MANKFGILFVNELTNEVEGVVTTVDCIRFINPASEMGPGAIGYNVDGKLWRDEIDPHQRVEIRHVP